MATGLSRKNTWMQYALMALLALPVAIALLILLWTISIVFGK